MIFIFDDDNSKQSQANTRAAPTSEACDIACIHLEQITHNLALHQADDEDDSFSKGYN